MKVNKDNAKNKPLISASFIPMVLMKTQNAWCRKMRINKLSMKEEVFQAKLICGREQANRMTKEEI